MSVQSMDEMGKDFCPNFLHPFLETSTEGAVTTGAESLFQYFTTLTENADSLLRRGSHLGVPCEGALLGRVERERGKASPDQYPKGP